MQFYSSYLDLLLKEITYEAESLKLQSEIETDDVFSISIFGFSHTVQKLIEQIKPVIAKEHRSQQGERLFKLALEDLKEQYENFYEDDIGEVADVLLDVLLKKTSDPVEQKLKALKSYKYKSICNRIDDFWKNARF